MGNCLPSCRKRNKVVPLRVYATSSTQAIPRYKPVITKSKRLSPSFGRQSSVRSIKPAAIDQHTTAVHVINEISSKLSNISFISADNSIHSVLVRCVRSNSEFNCESLPGDRPRAPTPGKMRLQYASTEGVSELTKKYIVGQSPIRAPEVDTLKGEQDPNIKEPGHESPQQFNIVVKEETQVKEDHATGSRQKERPVSSETYIVKYEDSYLRKKAREMSQLRKASRMVAPTTNDECPGNGGNTNEHCAKDSSKPERSVSAYFEHSEKEQVREAAPRKERPRQADYKARRPNFTDPLIIGDVSDEDFQGVFTDEDKRTGDAEEVLFSSELQEAIDYILTDKPISKSTGDMSQVEAQDDKHIIATNESECETVISPRQNYKDNGRLERITKLREQLLLTTRRARNAPYNEPVQEETQCKSQVGAGLVAPPNSPRCARARPPKTKPQNNGTLPSMMACSSRTSRAHGARGGLGRKGTASYSVEERTLMAQIQRQC